MDRACADACQQTLLLGHNRFQRLVIGNHRQDHAPRLDGLARRANERRTFLYQRCPFGRVDVIDPQRVPGAQEMPRHRLPHVPHANKAN